MRLVSGQETANDHVHSFEKPKDLAVSRPPTPDSVHFPVLHYGSKT